MQEPLCPQQLFITLMLLLYCLHLYPLTLPSAKLRAWRITTTSRNQGNWQKFYTYLHWPFCKIFCPQRRLFSIFLFTKKCIKYRSSKCQPYLCSQVIMLHFITTINIQEKLASDTEKIHLDSWFGKLQSKTGQFKWFGVSLVILGDRNGRTHVEDG